MESPSPESPAAAAAHSTSKFFKERDRKRTRETDVGTATGAGGGSRARLISPSPTATPTRKRGGGGRGVGLSLSKAKDIYSAVDQSPSPASTPGLSIEGEHLLYYEEIFHVYFCYYVLRLSYYLLYTIYLNVRAFQVKLGDLKVLLGYVRGLGWDILGQVRLE